MARINGSFPKYIVCSGVMPLLALSTCASPGERARLMEESAVLRRDKERLARVVEQRNATIARLHEQIATLTGFGPERPADLFSPVKLEIASLSGGADYDGKPGDDGVTVYLRPRDADGDAVKVPARITIQLLDNASLSAPRVLGLCVFDDPEQLRRLWHGRFATQHYTLKCPFFPDIAPPTTPRVTVSAKFVDYLTGATLTAVKEVSVSFAGK